jgi:hypothetical protein
MTVTGPSFAFPGIAHHGGGELQMFCTDGGGHGGPEYALRSWRSLDNGATWTQDSNVTTTTTARDPAGFVTSAGTTLVTAFAPSGDPGAFVYRSTDGGHTWSARINLFTIFDEWERGGACSGPVVQLADGTLVASVYSGSAVTTYDDAIVVFSSDDGVTWGGPVVVAHGDTAGHHFHEPNLLVLATGELVCFLRTPVQGVKRSVSVDGGLTWSTPTTVLHGLQGRPNAVQTADGTVVMFNRPAQHQRRAVYYTSADGGVTWGPQGVLTRGAGSVTPGPAGWSVYSQAVETSPNDLAVAFAVETGPGEPDSIAAASWLFFTRVTKATQQPVTVPDAPTIGTATGGDGQATVTFTAPAYNGGMAITGYTATSSPGGLTATGPSSPLTVSGLTNGVAYTFTVVATNSVGDSAPSAASNSVTPQAVPLDAPTGLSATGGDGQVALTWTASAGADGHRVWRHTADDFAAAVQVGADLGAAADSYTDTTAANGTTYWYWVTAFDTGGESGPSNGVSATPAPAGTFAPTDIVGLAAWYDASDSLTVSGGQVSGWADKSSHGRHLAQPGAEKPTVIAAAQNGLDVVNFANQFITHDAGTDQIDLAPMTLFVVARDADSTQTTSTWRRLVSSRQSATGPHDYQAPNFAVNKVNLSRDLSGSINGVGFGSAPYVSGAYFIAEWTGTADVCTVRVDGGTVVSASGNAMPGLQRYLRVGHQCSGSSNPPGRDAGADWAGQVAEIVVYNAALTAGQTTDVRSYLASKWGVGLT